MKKTIVLFTTILIAGVTLTAITSVNNLRAMPYKANYNIMSSDAKKQIECLAENIYFEAGQEPEVGKIAVAFVTINRVKSGRFENNICGVVKQKIQNICQFSWWCEERPNALSANKVLTNTNNPLYNSIRELAVYVYVNHEKMEDPSRGALFYHADYVNPQWRNMERLTVIGRHIFYNRKDLKSI